MPDPRDRERKAGDQPPPPPPDQPPPPGPQPPTTGSQPPPPLGGPPAAPADAPKLDETVEGGHYLIPIGNTGQTRAVDAEGRPYKAPKAERAKD